MIGTTIAHYRIEEKLGEGGMGEVYRAQDTQLDRKVALKFLPEHVQFNEIVRKRFIREAKSAASLDHPYICKIYEAGEVEGRNFIAMEYVKGPTLREKLQEDSIPYRQRLQIGMEIAEALEEAHRAGIVHRDLKPANIMLTAGGHVKVMDFGLAKKVVAEDGTEQDITSVVTRPGTTLGTPAYMSPEQLQNQNVDTRTDIFSFGIVLFELFSGVHPFRREGQVATMTAIIREEPPRLQVISGDSADRLEQTVHKMLEKDPDNRYQSVHEVRTNLKKLLEEFTLRTQVSMNPIHRPRRPWIWASVAVLIPVIIFGYWILNREELKNHPGVIKSIAVLPLENLSGDSDQEYFVEGMMDEIITDLSQISTLKVISRTSSMKFKDTDKSIPEIAEALRVDAIVEGSVLRVEDRVRVTIQLVHGSSDSHLWAESYVRDLKDILNLQNEIARTVSQRIGIVLGPVEEHYLLTTREVEPKAYEFYLKGNWHMMRLTEQDFLQAIHLYQESISLDPSFAPAYSGLAIAYIELGGWHTYTTRKWQEIEEIARKTALRALELDPDLGEAHIALARIHQLFQWNWIKADHEFKRGIRLDPGFTFARIYYANFLTALGRFEESISLGKDTIELDPLSPQTYNELAVAYELAGDDQTALKLYGKAIKIDPGFQQTNVLLSFFYARRNMFTKALELLDKKNGPNIDYCVAYIHGLKGKRNSAIALIDRLLGRRETEYVPACNLAIAYLGLGDKNEALNWLEEAYRERDIRLVWLKVLPFYDPLRSEPRFQELLRRINLQD
jgi:serine/threonine-protein kinase